MTTLFLIISIITLLFWAAPAEAVSVNVMWNDNSTDEDSFIVERRVGDCSNLHRHGWADVVILAANTTIFVDRDVIAGFTYCYRPNAVNAKGRTPGAAIEVYVPRPAASPAAPSGTSATIGP